MKFNSCLETLIKHAGILDKIKDVALTEVAGTKPWLIGRNAKAPVSSAFKATGSMAGKIPTGSAASGVRRAVRGPGAGGAYDVSDMAKKMGIT